MKPSSSTPVLKGLRGQIDWGSLAPLRMRSRQVAEGVYAGGHRSARRGAGVEFGGHREYTRGDDLRWLDRRALLLHDRLVVRQFETETDRALRIVIDATSSMAYRGKKAPGAKAAFAGLIAASLARIAISQGDPVGLSYIGGAPARGLPVSGGRESFERFVASLESFSCGGDATVDSDLIERGLGAVAHHARRGSIVVVLSDLLDLPFEAPDRIGAVSSQGRVLVVVELLDNDELTLPFEGPIRFSAMEGKQIVETEADGAREQYLAALEAQRSRYRSAIVSRDGRYLQHATNEDPTDVVRKILEAAR